MGDYLHRTTKRFRQSISPNELPEPLANYIEDPDLSAVAGVPSIYWIVTGDVISEMAQGEKDTVDAALLSSARDAEIQAAVDNLESVLRALTKMIISEINILRQQFNTTTTEVQQATNTSLADRTLAQVRQQLRDDLGT